MLGCTGSIGRQTLSVVDAHPEEFTVTALSADKNTEALLPLIKKYRPKAVALRDERAAVRLKNELPRGVELLAGESASAEAAAHPDADAVVVAVLGMAALPSLLSAIRAKKHIALANKESIVCGGELVQSELKAHDQTIYPIDSEQSAIFQCLQGIAPGGVERLILTASGGAFRSWSLAEMSAATPEQALQHPNWDMGRKITIDSATLINKGLEVIEAHYLFGVPAERIGVLLHPQSIVHSLVETVDGSLLAQLSTPDMRLAIQYALTYPQRLPSRVTKLDLTATPLEFSKPDRARFPGLPLAYDALKAGGTAPTVYNASNEAAVELFFMRKLGFLDIARKVEAALAAIPNVSRPALEDIYEADRRAREFVMKGQ